MYILDELGNIKTFKKDNGTIIQLEYRYLEYQKSDGYVVKIYIDAPTNISSDHAIAITSNSILDVGSEYENFIRVGHVDATTLQLIDSYMIRQPESVKFLRKERDSLAQQLQIASQTIADMTLQSSDLQNQLQTMAQTIAIMQIGG